MMLWEQAWKAPLSVVVVAVASDYLLSLVVVSVVVVALVAGWRSKHLLSLAVTAAVAVVVAVGGWRQRLPLGTLGTQLGIRTWACRGDLSCLCN